MWKLFTTLLEIIYVVPKHNGTTCAGIGLSIYLLVGIPELLLGYASNAALIAQLCDPRTSPASRPLFPSIPPLNLSPVSHTAISANQPPLIHPASPFIVSF